MVGTRLVTDSSLFSRHSVRGDARVSQRNLIEIANASARKQKTPTVNGRQASFL
jgi:hypothetical protein